MDEVGWKMEGWFKLEPGGVGKAGTTDRSKFYYYAEVLGEGEDLDRTPRWSRVGWWGRHDIPHNFSDIVSGFRQHVSEPNVPNVFVYLKIEDAQPHVVDTDDEDDEEEDKSSEHHGVRHVRVDEQEKGGGSGGSPSLARVPARPANNSEEEEHRIVELPRMKEEGDADAGTVGHFANQLQTAQTMLTLLDANMRESVSAIQDVRVNAAKAISDINEFIDAQQRALEKRRKALIEQTTTVQNHKAHTLSDSLIHLQRVHTSLSVTLSVAKDSVEKTQSQEMTPLQRAECDRLESSLFEIQRVINFFVMKTDYFNFCVAEEY
eukprot:c7594_g1_i1.p1 GENE.c7594_g1_i1~~c7594_g1_i1.p1  ORF type:complete len:320 (-),score=44.14 c7594_g1_i1:335-1294(-)